MFYEKQPLKQQNNYKCMLKVMGSLSNLFSESNQPYLYYRCHENIFCKYFEAQNLSREDSSADAQKGKIGIGLKTWVGADNQKIAEFNKLKEEYMNLQPYEMICKIASYRNERIRITQNLHGIDEMIYHIVKRVPNAMQIYEYAFEMIDIDNIKIDSKKSSATNIYFQDGKHEYHFNISKSTLYMIFKNMILLDSFNVDILEDPYQYLENIAKKNKNILDNMMTKIKPEHEQLCLRLYTVNRITKEKVVEQKSGLNQWNGARKGRDGNYKPRNPNEVYIPYPKKDRIRSKGFFPDRNVSFELLLPDGKSIQAKVCQENGKAIMSNPNSELGEWLLRNVFELPIGQVVTYKDLQVYGIDSVIFTKLGNNKYKIDFTYIGTYEKLLGIEDENFEN